MKQTIRLNETELQKLIMCAINEEMEEGFLKNAWKGIQAGTRANVNTQRRPNQDSYSQAWDMMKQRVQAGKQGYDLQKQYSRMDSLKQELQQLVDNGVISPRQTVNQLLNWSVGSKQNKDLGQGAKGFSGAKGDYQRQAKEMGIKLDEAVDKIMEKLLKK
jgi:hypothetical protein